MTSSNDHSNGAGRFKPTSGDVILVFGATGQQGGAVASALRAEGWSVTALVRDPNAPKSLELASLKVDLVQGNFNDEASIRSAMAGVYGVFSVQPSSGQGIAYGVSDEDEIRYGTMIADIAVKFGVSHFVYTSVNAAGQEKTGMGHFDSKSEIGAHLRSLSIPSTIIRPAGSACFRTKAICASLNFDAFIRILLSPRGDHRWKIPIPNGPIYWGHVSGRGPDAGDIP